MTIVRFAPAPTGRLHVGNIRAALFNALFARKTGGRFLLRIDDTDAERSTRAHEEAIRADLAWLGLDHDASFRQSERVAHYEAAAARLKEAGRLYPCYESAEELERKRRLQLARGRPPVYDRAALALTAEARARLEAEGRRPHWRFQLSGATRRWSDLVRGEVAIDTASLSDPVLIREDGTFLYTLPSVVDDAECAVTHIVRGEDHVTNSAAQIEIFTALGAAAPAMAHVSLLVGAEGEKLSKRVGSLSVEGLREAGIEPMAIVSLLARLGTSDPVEPFPAYEPLVASFDFAKLGRAPARFDVAELETLSERVLHALSFERAAPRLAALGIGGGAEFWEAVRGNLERLEDALAWWRIVRGPLAPVAGDPEFLAAAAAALPEGPLDEASWSAWTEALKARTGAKGKALYMPLRLALTGQPHGPEMAKLLCLIGRERILKRLAGKAA